MRNEGKKKILQKNCVATRYLKSLMVYVGFTLGKYVAWRSGVTSSRYSTVWGSLRTKGM